MRKRHDDLDRDFDRIYVIGYATAVLCSVSLVVAAYAYAYSCDPWMTPRYTSANILWWRMRDAFAGLLILLALIGAAGAFAEVRINCRSVFLAGLMLSTVALLLLAI